jgi:hypothetical protein
MAYPDFRTANTLQAKTKNGRSVCICKNQTEYENSDGGRRLRACYACIS